MKKPIYIIALLIFISSCNIQKRLYTQGYYLSKYSSSGVAIKSQKKDLHLNSNKIINLIINNEASLKNKKEIPNPYIGSVGAKNLIQKYPKKYFPLLTNVFIPLADTIKGRRHIKYDNRTPAEILADSSLIWLLLTLIISAVGLVVALVKSARAIYLNNRAEVYSIRAQKLATTVLTISIIFLALAVAALVFALIVVP